MHFTNQSVTALTVFGKLFDNAVSYTRVFLYKEGVRQKFREERK